MKQKSNFFKLLFFGSFAVFIIYGQFVSLKFEKDLKEHGLVTIGKIDSIREFPKGKNIHVSYCIKGKKYNSSESGSGHTNISKENKGEFFKLKYLKDSPEIVRGIYSQRIIDTVTILKSGFSITEIKP
ncbi:hypothetical protein [Flavobacterium turcicum]|uniref:YxeA family protein n=1 Tax=Flavobacterium turcicum TaxID=2764718 RepID=A0ABR7JC91_9FLAO|nr:hypothetical protein [Flavobacterium turcicum]MBC5862116.1 hypothetical protein [Flavobacterium turcicum]NHL00847.1 hypothetical protein [Flavobacterium turcicum]